MEILQNALNISTHPFIIPINNDRIKNLAEKYIEDENMDLSNLFDKIFNNNILGNYIKDNNLNDYDINRIQCILNKLKDNDNIKIMSENNNIYYVINNNNKTFLQNILYHLLNGDELRKFKRRKLT